MESFVDRRGVAFGALPDGVEGRRRWWAPSRLAPAVSIVALVLVFPAGRWVDVALGVLLYFVSYAALHLGVVLHAHQGGAPRSLIVRRDQVIVDGACGRVCDVIVAPAGRDGASRVAELVTDRGRVMVALGSGPRVEALARRIAAGAGLQVRAPGESEQAGARRSLRRTALALAPATLIVWAVFAAAYVSLIVLAIRRPDATTSLRPWLPLLGAILAVFPHALLGSLGVWLARSRPDRFSPEGTAARG